MTEEIWPNWRRQTRKRYKCPEVEEYPEGLPPSLLLNPTHRQADTNVYKYKVDVCLSEAFCVPSLLWWPARRAPGRSQACREDETRYSESSSCLNQRGTLPGACADLKKNPRAWQREAVLVRCRTRRSHFAVAQQPPPTIARDKARLGDGRGCFLSRGNDSLALTWLLINLFASWWAFNWLVYDQLVPQGHG